MKPCSGLLGMRCTCGKWHHAPETTARPYWLAILLLAVLIVAAIST